MTEIPFARHLEGKEQVLYDKLHGVVVPFVTPFLPDSGPARVDTESLSRLLTDTLPYVDVLFTGGNAGEGAALDLDNWRVINNTALEVRNKSTKKHIPVIAGVLRSDPAEVARFSIEAQKLGVDGIVVAPMCGGRPEKAVQAALDYSDLPIILYNNPKLSGGLELPLDFVKQVRDNVPRVVGIKTSSWNFDVFRKTVAMKSDTFRVFQGNTEDAMSSLLLGADGIVPVEANLNPILFANVYQASLLNKTEPQECVRQNVFKLLTDLKINRRKLKIGTAQMIKLLLCARKIIRSSRMYDQ